MTKQIEALLVTKGHGYAREPFFQMIDTVSGIDPDAAVNWTHVEHPAAEAVLSPQNAAPFDVIVFYDMPGVTFSNGTPPFVLSQPSDAYKENFIALLEQGKPMVFLHHAIAGWPAWDEYAHIIGGRFHFMPGTMKGKTYPGSGFAQNIQHTVTIEDRGHPIAKNMPASFPMLDEMYLMPVMEEDVQPLLRSNFDFVAENFPHGGVGYQSHERGSNLVGWTKTYKKAPIAYLQFGHGPSAFSNPYFHTLLSNAIQWGADSANHNVSIAQ